MLTKPSSWSKSICNPETSITRIRGPKRPVPPFKGEHLWAEGRGQSQPAPIYLPQGQALVPTWLVESMIPDYEWFGGPSVVEMCQHIHIHLQTPLTHHISSHLLNLKPSSSFWESNKSLQYISCIMCGCKMDVPGHGQWALGEGGWWASCSRAAKTLTLPTPSSPCVSLP